MSRFAIAIITMFTVAATAPAQQNRSDQETITLLITCAAYMEVIAPIDEETVRFDQATNPTLDKADLFVALAILADKEGALGTLRRLRTMRHNIKLIAMVSNGRTVLAETHAAKCADMEREVDYWKQKRLERAK